RNIGFPRPNVLCGPRYGVDCALVELDGGKAMALASDPLSYIPSIGIKESAFLSIHLTANDIATTGFSPQYGQFVLNLPVHVSDDRKSTRLNSSHVKISYAVFCLKKKR